MTTAGTLTPFDLSDAREAVKIAGRLQEEIERDLRDESRKLAECERVYREGLAGEMVRLKAESVAWTVCGDIARGDPRIARLRMERDIQAGILDAVRQAAYRRGADRRSLETIVQWSARRDLCDDHHGQREPDVAQPVFGSRRAAA